MVDVLLFWFLLFGVYVDSRRTSPYSHRLRNDCAETNALISLDNRFILAIFLVALISSIEFILTQESFELSLVGCVGLFRRAAFVRVESGRVFFRELSLFGLKILLSIVKVLVDILNGAFFFEVSANNSIILIKLLFFLFLFEFSDAFDEKFVEGDVKV